MVANVKFLKIARNLSRFMPAFFHLIKDIFVLQLAGFQTVKVNLSKAQELSYLSVTFWQIKEYGVFNEVL